MRYFQCKIAPESILLVSVQFLVAVEAVHKQLAGSYDFKVEKCVQYYLNRIPADTFVLSHQVLTHLSVRGACRPSLVCTIFIVWLYAFAFLESPRKMCLWCCSHPRSYDEAASCFLLSLWLQIWYVHVDGLSIYLQSTYFFLMRSNKYISRVYY